MADLPLGKPLALLGYLIAQPKPLTREHLADLFWTQLPPGRGRANLSWMLHQLTTTRSIRLEANRRSVQFQRSEATWIDTDAFQALTAQGDIGSMTEATALYRGDFLEGLSLDGCADFELWLVTERERWRQRLVRILEKLVVHHSDNNNVEEGIRFARQWLGLERWRESAHRHMMRLLALDGQRSASLAQYEICRRILATELDAEPGPETTALYETIKAATSVDKTASEGAPPPLGPSMSTHNLPAPLIPFIGRERELVEVRQLLEGSNCRLLTLVGPGGCGKTRLALEVVRTQIDRYRHGVYLVPLASLRSVDSLVPALAQAIGFAFDREGGRRQQLLDYLRSKHMLLLLDNFEHVPEGAELVIQILRSAPEVKILVTSRVRLYLQAEYLYPVEGLDYPGQDSQSVQDLRRNDAVRLFIEGAKRVNPHFLPHPDQLPTIAKICRLVEGMPLATLLAAAWSETLIPTQIAIEIERNLDFLSRDWSDLPERQHSIRMVFDHSWNLLTPRLRTMMRALSVFRGSFTQAGAQSVIGASMAELNVLYARSLLHRTASGRFQLHELLRQYAIEKLNRDAQERDAVQARHSEYYIRFLANRESPMKHHRQQVELEALTIEIQDIRVAWEWAISHVPRECTAAQLEQINKAIESLWLLHDIRAWFQEGERAFRLALEALASCPLEERHQIIARILARQAGFSYRLGAFDEAKRLYERSIQLCLDHDMREETAFPLYGLGYLAYEREDYGKATDCLQQSLAIYRQSGDQWSAANALRGLGTIAYRLGDFAVAEQRHQEALALRREIGDQWGIAKSLRALGAVIHDLGDVERARQLYQESRLISETLGDRRGSANVLNSLSAWAESVQAYDEATRFLKESLEIWREIGDYMGIAVALTNLGNIARAQGTYDEAIAWHQQNLARSRERGDRRAIALSLIDLGAVAREMGDYDDAKRCYRECVAICRDINHLWGLALATNRLGRVASLEGRYVDAQQRYQESLSISKEIGDHRAILVTYSDLGDVACALQDFERSGAYFKEALKLATNPYTMSAIVDLATRVAELCMHTNATEDALALLTFASDCATGLRTTRTRAMRLSSTLTCQLPAEAIEAAHARAQSWNFPAIVKALWDVLGKVEGGAGFILPCESPTQPVSH